MHFLSVLSTNRKITVKPAPFSRRSSNVWLEAQLSKIHEQRSRAGDKKRGNRLEISVGPRCVSLPDVFRSDCRIDRVRSRCLLHACNASCIYMHITDDAAGARQRVCVCVCVCRNWLQCDWPVSYTPDATRGARVHAEWNTRANTYIQPYSKIGVQLGTVCPLEIAYVRKRVGNLQQDFPRATAKFLNLVSSSSE